MDAKEVIRQYSPLSLAYYGDAVYEKMVREHLLAQGESHVNAYHRRASLFVSAAAQNAIMEWLEPTLSEQEREIYHRGRNAKSHSRPKNADMVAYRRATGFEALIGFLALCGKEERIKEIFMQIIKKSEETA